MYIKHIVRFNKMSSLVRQTQTRLSVEGYGNFVSTAEKNTFKCKSGIFLIPSPP